MKRYLLLLLFIALIGCSGHTEQQTEKGVPVEYVETTRKGDSTACAYWQCSKEKKLYMQKYVKNATGQFRPAGTFRLDEGIGAFPLEDLDKYASDGDSVSTRDGFDPCPYCRNTVIIGCPCGKIKKLQQPINISKTFCGCCGGHVRYTMQHALTRSE